MYLSGFNKLILWQGSFALISVIEYQVANAYPLLLGGGTGFGGDLNFQSALPFGLQGTSSIRPQFNGRGFGGIFDGVQPFRRQFPLIPFAQEVIYPNRRLTEQSYSETEINIPGFRQSAFPVFEEFIEPVSQFWQSFPVIDTWRTIGKSVSSYF